MDAPGDQRHNLEVLSDSSDGQDALPELSRSQTTLDVPPSPGLKKRKSQRTRPADPQQHAAPPAPLKTPLRQPEPRPKVSKTMSLFSLFSKPKVEKLRGYAEQGLSVPASPLLRTSSNLQVPTPQQSFSVRAQDSDQGHLQARPATSRSYSARAARLMSRETIPPANPNAVNEQKAKATDMPPLFQVWPQTIKHGIFEVPPTEVVSQKPKGRTNLILFTPGGEVPSLNVPGNRGSIESKITIKSSLRHTRSSSNLALSGPPTKLFVLTTTGYLCQYACEGNNERLPERVLRLGKDSAAYASDSIAGKHHVLKVAHAVDQHGTVVGDSQSLLSRIGMRGHPKRTAFSFLLIMPNAEEMGIWMRAIREEIDVQGGKAVRTNDSTSRPTTGKPVADLKKAPSVRYQIKRDPHGPSNISTPVADTPSAVELEGSHSLEEPVSHDAEGPSAESVSDTQSQQDNSLPTRPRAPSDTPSMSSSTAMSVDQQQLDKLRNSARMSHASTVATSVMTATSCTNSMASSPTDASNDNALGARDSKPSYRNLSSATLAKRRSAAPLSLKDSQRCDAGALHPLQSHPYIEAIHSPVVGYGSPIPEPSRSPISQQLRTAQSVPNLKTIAEPGSSLPFPMSTPAEERPESFLADLPDPTTWANKHSPSYRATVIQPLPEAEATTDFSQFTPPSTKSRSSPVSRPLRNNSNSFSVPLRVNPIEPATPPPIQSPARPSSGEQEGRVSCPVPAVTTLEAKVDIAKRTSIDASHIPPRRSSTFGSPPRDVQATANCSRLSLFPAAKPLPPPPIMPIKGMRTRSPSAASVTPLGSSPTMSSGKRLARPASLQVRSDRAPFLASMRNSEGPVRSVTTAPIRALKPSRSAGNMLARSPSRTEQRNGLMVQSSGDSEAADEITPLVDSLHSPLILGSVAHQSTRSRRAPRIRSSMPDLDVAALGPPAPPPSTPLPELPPAAPRNLARKNRQSIVRSITPIGLAIGEALGNVQGESPTKPMPTLGLGIQVVRGS